MGIKFCLVFPREALSVPVMRRVLGDELRGLGADEAGLAELLLAVTEACSNVVRHGGPGREYEVVAYVASSGCLIEVLNSGPGIDPVATAGFRLRRPLWPSMPAVVRIRRRSARGAISHRAPAGWPHRRARHRGARRDPVAALPESGRGLAIMQAFVDDVSLRSGPELGTVVSLQKRIAWRSDGPLSAVPAGPLRDAG